MKRELHDKARKIETSPSVKKRKGEMGSNWRNKLGSKSFPLNEYKLLVSLGLRNFEGLEVEDGKEARS